MSRSLARTGLVLGFVLALAAAGCGQNATATTPGAASPGAGSTGASSPGGAQAQGGQGSTPAATTAGGGAAMTACSLLTDADILELTGATVVEKLDNVMDTIYANHCRWTLQKDGYGAGEINLGVVTPGGRDYYQKRIGITNPTQIDGLQAEIGTKDRNTSSIYAVKGETVIDLFTLGVVAEDVDIANRILQKISF